MEFNRTLLMYVLVLKEGIEMKIFKIFATLFVAMLILGCAQNLWVKPNSNQGEFERDRYSCLQQSQQRVGAAQVDAYGGSAFNTVRTNDMLFSTCMGSKGWSLQNKEIVQTLAIQNQAKMAGLKQQFDEVLANIVAMCNKEELREYYKKSACKAPDVSFEQLADATKITSEQKIALIKQREQVALLEKDQDELQKQRGDVGLKIISISSNFIRPENEKNNLDLYNGKITWGEYNKRRKEIYVEGQNKLR